MFKQIVLLCKNKTFVLNHDLIATAKASQFLKGLILSDYR